MLSDQQVLDSRHVLEQAHVLEGAHHAFAGNFVTGQAFNRLAIEQNASGRRLVEPGQAVKDGGFTRPVGADHGNHLFFLHGQAHAVDRQQAAKAHAQAADFQYLAAHFRSSR